MAERKPCIRCERPIDANARSCVYCNWDQGLTKPVQAAAAPAPAAYVPPRDTRLRNRILGAIAFVALVIIAFVVGSLVHGSDPSQAKASQTPHPATSTAQAAGGPRADVTLVPVDGSGSMQSEPPITSAPALAPSAGNVEVNGDRTDATALPSGEYSAAAQRAKAERDLRTGNGMIDPRTIPGGVDRSVPVNRDRQPSPRAEAIRVAARPHTEPIPLYQPVPPLRVDRATRARLFLTVGTDGRVHDIDIAQSIPGEMPRLIASVQNWRFKPATQNGQPVTSTFSVDINVRPQ
jgi:cell division septation protein DedD